ncbi:LysR substrate-binding domain-containing protein, partial [Nguyenibacter vanlangensis]
GRGGARPTPQGTPLLAQIGRVVRESRAVLELARTHTTPLDGRLALGVIPTLGPYYIPGLLQLLRARLPGLSLRLTEERTEPLLAALADYTLDAALIALPADQPGLVAEPLFFEPFHALLPADHPLAAQPALSVTDLARPDLLLLEDGHCLRAQTVSLCHVPAESQRAANPRVAPSLEMLRHMVAAGEGIALMPALAIQDRIQDRMGDGALTCSRPLTDPRAGRRIGLAWRATDPRGADFTRLAELLRA